MAKIQVAVGDDDLRNLLALLVDMRGHRPQSSPDLMATWSHLEAGDIDLLILDRPPDADAQMALVARCRAQPHLEELPIVVVGAPVNDHDLTSAHAAGVTSFVAMPFTMVHMTQVITELTRPKLNHGAA